MKPFQKLCVKSRQVFKPITNNVRHFYNHFAKCLLLILFFPISSTMGQVTANFSALGATEGCGSLVVEFNDNSTGNPTTWWWDFGNGLTSIEQNPTVFYDSPGVYDVHLKVSDATSLDTLTLSAMVEVFAVPDAQIQLLNNMECAPMEAQFSDLSTSATPLVSWFWDFGDGGNSTLQNPTYQYVDGGAFSVSLLVVDANACQDLVTVNNMAKVLNNPKADFSVNTPVVCDSSETVSFTNTSQGLNNTYKWNLGDGTISLQESPTHVYNQTGLFGVALLAVSEQGCSDTFLLAEAVRVLPELSASVTASSTEICDSTLLTSFTATSNGANELVWNFGDGQTATQENPTHQYQGYGVYDLALSLSFDGLCSNTVTDLLSIRLNPNPSVDFVVDSTFSCELPFEVSFTNVSLAAATYLWDFGDGGSSAIENPTYVYTQEGEHTVALTIVDTNTCQATKTIDNLIDIELIDLGFVASENKGCFPLEIDFTDTSVSADPIVSWVWDFGDGATSTDELAQHTYLASGVYDVALAVSTASGCSEQLIVPGMIKVSEPALTQFSVADTVVCASDPVLFTDESISAELIDSWTWDFGDGASSNDQHPTHLFQDTGYVDISLITSVGGCLDTLRVPSLVYVASPAVQFTDEHNCELPYKVEFVPTLIGADSWAWDLGDGNVSTEANFAHDYADRGEYTVKLTAVNNASGCVTESSKLVKVSEPQALFEVDSLTPAVGCPPLYVSFRDLSIDQYFDFLWYGDGDSSNWMYYNEYEEPGYYDVQQLVVDEYGCRDTLRIDSMIHVIDVNAEVGEPNLIDCFPFSMELTDNSTATDSIVFWSWNISDGQSFTTNNPSVSFSSEGIYDVSLSVKTALGCLGTTTAYGLIEYDKPYVSIEAGDSILCEAETVGLNSYVEGILPTLSWDLANGELATGPSVEATYLDTGSYTVLVNLVDSFGCTASAQKELVVARPLAQFSASSVSSDCPPLITQFNDVSSQGIVAWEWNFGDGAFSSVSDPSHLYAESGDYDVSLIVTDAYGCKDSLLQNSVVSIMGPYGTFAFTDTSVCAFEPIDFSSDFTNTVSVLWDFNDGTFATGSEVTHEYTDLGNYLPTVLIENAVGCQKILAAEDTIRVSSNTISLDLSPDTTICKYESTQININSNGSIVSWTPSVGLSDTTVLNPVASPLVSTDYVVLLADGYCFNKDTIRITVDEELPAPSLAHATLCVGSEVQFEDASNPLSAVAYYWDFNDGTTSEEATPAHTFNTVGEHLVDLQLSYLNSGCSAAITDTVYVHALPIADAGLDQSICEHETASLMASGGVLYDWGLGFTSDSVHTVFPVETTQYQLAVLDANGCVNTDVTVVNVKPAPVVQAGEDRAICPEDSVLLSGSGAGALYWNGEATPSTDYLFTGTVSQHLYLEVVDSNNCRSIDSVLVTVNELPEINVLYPKTLCVGVEYAFEGVNAQAGAMPQLQWDFSNGNADMTDRTMQSFSQEGAASFELFAVSKEGCEHSYFIDDLMVYANPEAAFNFTEEGVTDLNPEVTFFNNSHDVEGLVWDFGDGYFSEEFEPVHAYDEAGEYLVRLSVENVQGCQASIEKNLVVETDYKLFVPNAFTPNGDNIDEVFTALGYGIVSFRMIVFNRWGEEVFVTEDMTEGWNGFLPTSQRAPTGTYSYRIVTEDAGGKVRTYHGELNLIL